MVMSSKKRKSTIEVSEPQKKSPRGKRSNTNAPQQNDTNEQVTLPLGKGKLKNKKAGKPETPLKQKKSVKASPTPEVGTVPQKVQKKDKGKKESPVGKKAVPPKNKITENKGEDGKTLSKSVKARLSKKNRIVRLREKAQEGDTESLTKIQEVIKKLQSSTKATKHSKRKLGQYKSIMALISSKEGKSTPKKAKKAAKQAK